MTQSVNFNRYAQKINGLDPSKEVQSIEITPTIADATGTIQITDLKLQDGDFVTGWMPQHNELLSYDRSQKKTYSAIIKGSGTVVMPNTGDGVGPLDIKITARTAITKMTIDTIFGTRVFKTYSFTLMPGDEFVLSTSDRQVTINGVRTTSYAGFYKQSTPGFQKIRFEFGSANESATVEVSSIATNGGGF